MGVQLFAGALGRTCGILINPRPECVYCDAPYASTGDSDGMGPFTFTFNSTTLNASGFPITAAQTITTGWLHDRYAADDVYSPFHVGASCPAPSSLTCAKPKFLLAYCCPAPSSLTCAKPKFRLLLAGTFFPVRLSDSFFAVLIALRRAAACSGSLSAELLAAGHAAVAIQPGPQRAQLCQQRRPVRLPAVHRLPAAELRPVRRPAAWPPHRHLSALAQASAAHRTHRDAARHSCRRSSRLISLFLLSTGTTTSRGTSAGPDGGASPQQIPTTGALPSFARACFARACFARACFARACFAPWRPPFIPGAAAAHQLHENNTYSDCTPPAYSLVQRQTCSNRKALRRANRLAQRS